MIEQLNYSGEFFIENIKFKLGITNNITCLPFIEYSEQGISTAAGVQMIELDKKIFWALLYLIPLPALKKIYNSKQNCRKYSTFNGFTYQDLNNVNLGFVQVLQNYNNLDEQLFIFVEAIFASNFNEKIKLIMQKFDSGMESKKLLFPFNKDLQDFQMHCETGNILNNAGLFTEALAEYRISLRLEGNNANAFYGIANIFDKTEDYPKALKFYLKTKNIDPTHPKVHQKLGDLHHKLGQSDQAIDDYSRVIEVAGDKLLTGYSHFSMGIIHEEKNKLSKAIAQYKKAIKIRPGYDFAYYKLGDVYLQKGDIPKAISYIEKAISLQPNKFVYYDLLALAYSRIEDYEKAIWSYKMLLKFNETDIRTLLNLGFSYSMNKDFKFAILTYRKALEINSENPEIYYYIGLAYVSHNKSFEDALNFYKKALSLDAKHIHARNQIGLIYYINKDYSKAIKEFQACIRYSPGFVLAYKNLGLLYIELKKYQNTIDYYSKAISLEKGDFECFYNRGLAYYYEEDWANSIEDFNTSKSLNPDFTEVNEFLGKAEKNYLIELEKINIYRNSFNFPKLTEET